MKKVLRSASFGIILIVTLLFAPVNNLTAQELQEPVKFQYGGDMKIKQENSKHWLYTYCNKYEGDTCTNPDGAVRVEIGALAASLLKLAIK